MINGHGDDIYSYDRPIISNFSSNVFYGADLSGLKEHLCNHLDAIGNYPEPEPYTLEKELAAHYHIPAINVCATNGGTEAIYLVAQAFRETNSAILVPTFSEYADACCMHSHPVTFLYSLENIPDTVRMVWICNPNNPTGTVLDKDYLLKIIQSHPDVCFVIDMAYKAFTLKRTLIPEEALAEPNVILLHSLTKEYAIPGLRLGYITAPQHLLEQIRAHRMPWSVNQLAIEAGLYILRNEIPCCIDMPAYLDQAACLKDMLEATKGIEVWPTDTHFMLARLRLGKAGALKEYLANEYGYLIRDASNFKNLSDEYFRVAAQTPEENVKLVEYIEKWFALWEY